MRTDFYKFAIPGPPYHEKLCAAFDISTEGKISKIHFFRNGMGHGIDSLAYEKALMKMQGWTPGIQNKKNVAVSNFTIMLEDPNEMVVPFSETRAPLPLEEPEVWTVVEQPAEPQGGSAELGKRAKIAIERPACYANDTSIKSCKVHLKFIVDTLGNCIAPEILRPCKNCNDLNARALQVIASEKAWQPARNRNKKVKVYYNLPIVFTFVD
jgi:hypothetical protein